MPTPKPPPYAGLIAWIVGGMTLGFLLPSLPAQAPAPAPPAVAEAPVIGVTLSNQATEELASFCQRGADTLEALLDASRALRDLNATVEKTQRKAQERSNSAVATRQQSQRAAKALNHAAKQSTRLARAVSRVLLAAQSALGGERNEEAWEAACRALEIESGERNPFELWTRARAELHQAIHDWSNTVVRKGAAPRIQDVAVHAWAHPEARHRAIQVGEAVDQVSSALRQIMKAELAILNAPVMQALGIASAPSFRKGLKSTRQQELDHRIAHHSVEALNRTRARLRALELRLRSSELRRADRNRRRLSELRAEEAWRRGEAAQRSVELRARMDALAPELKERMLLAERLVTERRLEAAERLLRKHTRSQEKAERAVARALMARVESERAVRSPVTVDRGTVNSPSATEWLGIAAGKATQPKERLKALAALARLEGGWATNPLRPLLSHADLEVRRAAVRALAAEGSLDAVGLLILRLGEPDADLRAEVTSEIARLRAAHDTRLELLEWLAGARERESKLGR